MTERENSLNPSPLLSSLLPSQAPTESLLGSFVTMISINNLRYQGNISHLNLQNSTLGLQNVLCHGQIPPSNQLRPFILFKENYIKEILVTTPLGFIRHGNASLTREATKLKPRNATKKTKLPPISSSYHPQASHDSPQSFFTTFPPAPISLGKNSGAFDFEANFKQYEMWGAPEREAEVKEEKPETTSYSTDGWFDNMISRKPFEPIGRPYNPYGPIKKPVKHTKEIVYRSQWRPSLQQPPANFRYEY